MKKDRLRSKRTGRAAMLAAGAVTALLLLPPALMSAGGPSKPPVRVVFSGLTEGGSWDLWLAAGDGSHLIQARNTPDVDERTPVLSPDRKYVAYSTSRGEIQLYNTYDQRARALTLPGAGRAAWPAWGPSGESLYYVEVLMGQGPDEGRVWRYDVQTGKGEVVADEPEVEGWPSVSDEGVLLFTTWKQSQIGHLSSLQPSAKTPSLLWDRSLTVSGAAQLTGGRIAAIAGDARGQKLILLRAGKVERELEAPGASGRPVAYENGLLLTRIEGGLATIHVMDLGSGQMRAWTRSVPKGLAQMRDPDYR